MTASRADGEPDCILDDERGPLLDTAMVYRCLNDSDWTMLWVSDGCRAVTGYAPSDLVANRRVSYSGLILADDRLEVSVAVQDALERDQPFQLSYRIQSADGRVVTVWEQGYGVRGPTQRIEYLEGVIAAAGNAVE